MLGKRNRKKAMVWQWSAWIASGVMLFVGTVTLVLSNSAQATPPFNVSGAAAETAVTIAPTITAAVSTPTTATTTTTSTTAASLPVSQHRPPTENGKVLLSVEIIHQFPEYPTGCESVATVMALRYAGWDISVADFIDNYLPCSADFYWHDGKFYGPSPYEYFLGNPRTYNSYGCMASAIKKALTGLLKEKGKLIDATGESLASLCSAYIDRGYPVIVWVSINMLAIKDGRQWILPNGSTYIWPSNEHCMVLVGYDAHAYYFNDPYTGRVVAYSRKLADLRYAQMGKQALVIQ